MELSCPLKNRLALKEVSLVFKTRPGYTGYVTFLHLRMLHTASIGFSGSAIYYVFVISKLSSNMNATYDSFGRNFWCKLQDLQIEDEKYFCVMDAPMVAKEEIISRIEDIVVEILHQISSGASPSLKIRRRYSWNNCVYVPNVGLQMAENSFFATISLANEASVEKFGLILKVMSMIYKLLKSGQVATKRDLFYEEPHLFQNQGILDRAVDDIACMLKVPRRCLNVVATSKGCIAGDLVFTGPDGERIDCSQASAGVMVPTQIDKIGQLQSEEARFVLVIEKDATFQRLLDDDFLCSMPCIMVTGKGVPDVNTRLMIRKIWNVLRIPVFGLMDADPHGLEIMFVYRFGSMSQSFDSSSLALPFMKWIGVFPSDIKRLRLPPDVVMALTSKDESKCRDMLSRPYIEYFPKIESEIHEMLSTKQKAEIQALTRISAKYLNQVFISSKIKHGSWI